MKKIILVIMIVCSGLVYSQDTLNYTKIEINALLAKVDSLLHQSALLDSFQALRGEIATKQPLLISGTNIKTVNSNSLLGMGDVSISSDTTGFWAIVNGLVTDALANSDTLLASAETLDSLTIAFWNGTLSGFDSTYIYQQLALKLAKSDSSTVYATLTMLGNKLDASTYNSFVSTLSGGTTDQVLSKVDATNYNWNWSTISGGVVTDTIPNNFEFDDVTDAALNSYHTDYIIVVGCDSARFYPASGDTIRVGALGTKTVSPIWADNGDTVYTFCVASGTNSTTTRSIVYSANGTPVDSFNVTTVAASGATPFATLDFEEGNLSEWSSTSGANLSASTTFAHTGTYSMRVGTNSLGFYDYTATDTVWATFWVYLPSTSSQSATTNYIAMFNNGIADRTNFATNQNGGATWEEWLVGVNSGDLTDGDYTTNFSQNTWHKIKMKYETNGTTTSYHQVWVDGTSIWSATAAYVNTVSNFTAGSEAATITGYFYVDDINLYLTDPDL